jgi:hypothetical protein
MTAAGRGKPTWVVLTIVEDARRALQPPPVRPAPAESTLTRQFIP